jgi:hypothetical protein
LFLDHYGNTEDEKGWSENDKTAVTLHRTFLKIYLTFFYLNSFLLGFIILTSYFNTLQTKGLDIFFVTKIKEF